MSRLATTVVALLMLVTLSVSVQRSVKDGNDQSRSMSYFRNATTPAQLECVATDCESCTNSKHCVWCHHDNVCSPGSWTGGCKGWMYKQCAMDGVALIVVATIGSAIVVFIIVMFLFCFFCRTCRCNFCRCCPKKLEKSGYTPLDIDAATAAVSNRGGEEDIGITESQRRRQELKEKYGIA